MSFISFERAITHPSLLDKTTTGLFSKSGLKSRSQETKKLLQSSTPILDSLISLLYQLHGILDTMQAKTTEIDTRFFRAGVGTVIYNQKGEVALFERAKFPVGVWQFQQGGIDLDEAVETALWRELKEEIGLSKDEINKVTEMPGWTVYQDMNSDTDSSTHRLGQVHHWYFLELKPDCQIDLKNATDQEASQFRWVYFAEAIAVTNDRKKHVYQQLETYFLENIKN